MATESIVKISQNTYLRLRKLAQSVMRRESRAVTLSPTVLLHEALLRWRREDEDSGNGAKEVNLLRLIMRHLVIDFGRRRASLAALRAGAGVSDGMDAGTEDRVAVRRAMKRLAVLDKRQAAIVEMKVLGGLTLAQIAERMDCCSRTVQREWTTAQLWLRRELGGRGN